MSTDPNVFEHAGWERDLGGARGSRLAPAIGLSDLGCAVSDEDYVQLTIAAIAADQG